MARWWWWCWCCCERERPKEQNIEKGSIHTQLWTSSSRWCEMRNMSHFINSNCGHHWHHYEEFTTFSPFIISGFIIKIEIYFSGHLILWWIQNTWKTIKFNDAWDDSTISSDPSGCFCRFDNDQIVLYVFSLPFKPGDRLFAGFIPWSE